MRIKPKMKISKNMQKQNMQNIKHSSISSNMKIMQNMQNMQNMPGIGNRRLLEDDGEQGGYMNGFRRRRGLVKNKAYTHTQSTHTQNTQKNSLLKKKHSLLKKKTDESVSCCVFQTRVGYCKVKRGSK